MSYSYPNTKAGPAPADARIQNDSDARAMIDEGITSHFEYHELIELQQQHLDGKPPYDPDKLREGNLSWMKNRAYGKATARSEKITSEKTFTVIGGYSFGYPVFEIYDEEKHLEKANWLRDENLKDHYANAIRIAYATTVEKEPRAYDMVSRVCYYSVNWGIGFVTRDNDDWLGYGQKLTEVFFPRAQEFDQIDTFFTFGERNVAWFFERYEKAKNDPNSPWNIEAIKDILIWSLGTAFAEAEMKNKKIDVGMARHFKWEMILSSWETNSFAFSRDTTMVRFAKVWNEELKGGVTETYVVYQGDTDGSGSITNELLFQTHYSDRCIFDFIEWFRDNPITSTGVVQNIRGLARFSVPDSHHYNVKHNAIEDKLMLAGNLQFEQGARNQGEKFDLHMTSIATIMPVGFKLVENPQVPRIQEHLQAITLDEQTYQRETQHYDPSIGGRLGDRATTKEVERQQMEVSRIQNAKDVILREDWGRFHKNCLLRLANDKYKDGDTGYKGQKCFLRELARAAGVSEEDAKEIVSHVEDFEMAPVLGDSGAMKESIQLTPDPYQKNELIRQLLYMMGHSRARVEFLRPRMNRFEIVSGESQLADLQNNMLWDQVIPLFNPQNDPKVALDVHFKRFDEAITSASNGADPVRVLNYLRTGLFFTQNHLQRMAEDPFYGEDAAKPYLSKYQGYQRMLGTLQEVATRAAMKQQQPQVDPEVQQKMQLEAIEFQGKEERKQMNQQAEGARKQEKHQIMLQQKNESHAQQLMLNWQRAATENAG